MASKITVFTDTLTGTDYNIDLPVLTDSEATAYLNGKIAEINNVLYTKIEKTFPASSVVPVTEYLNYNIDTRKFFNVVIKWVYYSYTNTIYGYKRECKILNDLPASVYKVNSSEGTIDLTATYTTEAVSPSGGYRSVPSTVYYYKTGTDRWYNLKAVPNNSIIDLPFTTLNYSTTVYGGYFFNMIYYSSNTNSIKAISVSKDLGGIGAQTRNAITWLSNVPASKVSQPTISGDPTADIDTDTGESETQDSEDNIGGQGSVTLINNVINYDDYSPNYARVNTGFITAFKVTDSELNTLHSFLYSETILDLVKNYFAGDATKAIVDLFNIPIAPAVEANSTEIKVGVIGTGAVGNVLSSETATFDFGSIDITQGYNSNSFMDLDPYNKYMIFLPFIGFKTLNTNDIRSINDTGFKIYLKYIVDMLTGDFVAVIEADHNNAVFDNDTGTLTTAKLTKQVINTFSGNMRTAIPLNSINSREAITPALGALATAIAGASTGNPLVMAQSVGSSLNSMANYNNALIPRGDSLSGNIGNLTINKAFVINQESPKYIRTGKSNQLVGYPVYKYMQITKDRGYVKVKDLIMSGFTGTAKEAEALEALLKGGVWTQ